MNVLLHKLNCSLLIIALVLGLADGGYWVYTNKLNTIKESSFIHELGGDE